MYYKYCRYSNGQSKSSYDVTDYWRKMTLAVKKTLPHLQPGTLSLHFPPIVSYCHMSILSVHCYEDDIFHTLERIQDEQTL